MTQVCHQQHFHTGSSHKTRAFTRQKLVGTRSPSVRSLQYRTFISVGPKTCTSANPIRFRSRVIDAGLKQVGRKSLFLNVLFSIVRRASCRSRCSGDGDKEKSKTTALPARIDETIEVNTDMNALRFKYRTTPSQEIKVSSSLLKPDFLSASDIICRSKSTETKVTDAGIGMAASSRRRRLHACVAG